MSELASMHASRIGTVFGRDLDAMEKQIERKTTEVTTLFRKAERYLQKVGASTKRAGGEEAMVGANVQRRWDFGVSIYSGLLLNTYTQ